MLNHSSALPLRIGLVSGILHPRHGGPAMVMQALNRYISSRADISIWGQVGTGEEKDLREIYPDAHLFSARFPARWFRCAGLRHALLSPETHLDVLHSHMLWDYPTYAAWRASRRRGIPLIVTPHGSVNELWRQRGLHKKLYRGVVLGRMYRDVTCMQALNSHEKEALQQFGATCPIEVIPNGTDPGLLTIRHTPGGATKAIPALRRKKCLLFLGRICKEKGLDLLIAAWSNLRRFHSEWTLVLCGPDYRGFDAELDPLVKSLGVEAAVLRPGMVSGPNRDALLSGTDAFVLPSRSEGFSVALLEALASGVPAIYSDRCNFPEAALAGAGVETTCTVEGIADGLDQVLGLSDIERLSMGAAGRALVAQRYTWPIVADAMLCLYERMVSGGTSK